MFVDKLDVFGESLKSFWDVNVNGEFILNEFTQLDDEFVLHRGRFQDGTAERRQHSTVHVHRIYFACLVFLCGKGSEGIAVKAVCFGVLFLHTRRGGGRPLYERRAPASD